MPGIFERVRALAGSDLDKATNLAQQTYQHALGEHGHHGSAFIATVARLCREHPNLVGILVGIGIEQFLTREERSFRLRHLTGEAAPEAALAEAPAGASGEETPLLLTGPLPPADPHAHRPHAPHMDFSRLHPGRIGFEVFGALLLLKLGLAVSHAFRRHKRPEGWLASAARIHLFSGALAAYYFAASLKSKKISARRNAALLLFGTDAIKPLLKAHDPYAHEGAPG